MHQAGLSVNVTVYNIIITIIIRDKIFMFLEIFKGAIKDSPSGFLWMLQLVCSRTAGENVRASVKNVLYMMFLDRITIHHQGQRILVLMEF